MSYPYPQDRHRNRKEKGDQPYKDAREAMSQNEAHIQAEAEAFGKEHLRQTDEEQMEQLEVRGARPPAQGGRQSRPIGGGRRRHEERNA